MGWLPARAIAAIATRSTATAAATTAPIIAARARRGLALDVAFRLRQQRLAREAHASVAIDLDDLHIDLVAELHVRLDRFDALPIDLGDVEQAVFARRKLQERSVRLDAHDLRLVGLPDLGRHGQA